jgi:CheY-like chemotaxis protein
MRDRQGNHQLVLVVEDEALVRMNGVDILEDAGYTVLEAANADEAMEILNQALNIELLFSDIDMPGSMDGAALAQLVHERWPKIHLLLTSGHHRLTDADVPDHGRFLQKPYSGEAMVEKIDTCFKG